MGLRIEELLVEDLHFVELRVHVFVGLSAEKERVEWLGPGKLKVKGWVIVC